MPEDDVECEPFTIIYIDSLLVSEIRYYLQVYLDNCACKFASKERADYLDVNLFETFEGYFLINRFYKCCIMTELI